MDYVFWAQCAICGRDGAGGTHHLREEQGGLSDWPRCSCPAGISTLRPAPQVAGGGVCTAGTDHLQPWCRSLPTAAGPSSTAPCSYLQSSLPMMPPLPIGRSTANMPERQGDRGVRWAVFGCLPGFRSTDCRLKRQQTMPAALSSHLHINQAAWLTDLQLPPLFPQQCRACHGCTTAAKMRFLTHTASQARLVVGSIRIDRGRWCRKPSRLSCLHVLLLACSWVLNPSGNVIDNMTMHVFKWLLHTSLSPVPCCQHS